MESDVVGLWLGFLGLIVGGLGTGLAMAAWREAQNIREDERREKKRLNQKIQISLVSTDREQEPILLPGELRREQVSRPEILGRIGMINGGKRFSIGHMNTKEFIDDKNRVVEGNSDNDHDNVINIICKHNEMEQFDQTETKPKRIKSKPKRIKRAKRKPQHERHRQRVLEQ